MTISIHNYKLPVLTHNLYDVTICNEVIRTLVTHTPSMIDSWISDIKRTHRDKSRRLIVGLDVEWLPNLNRFTENPPATLQLCVGGRCLIFQLLYSRTIPQSLVEFLRNVDYEFMGVEIEKDADKLSRFYDLKVVNVVDLRDLAVEKLGREEQGFKNRSLRCRNGRFVRVALGTDPVTPPILCNNGIHVESVRNLAGTAVTPCTVASRCSKHI